MKKNWIALLLALCMLITMGTASACCADACCTDMSGMDETRTMEETCPCMMDGKGVDGCSCTDGASADGCSCLENGACTQDGMCEMDEIEEKLEMLEDELNAMYEMNMDLWEKFFGLMDKQPDMEMDYADYLMEQLEMAKEKLTEEEIELLTQDIETIRRIEAEIAMLEESLMPNETIMAGKCMKDGKCVSECPCDEGTCTEDCDCMADMPYEDMNG